MPKGVLLKKSFEIKTASNGSQYGDIVFMKKDKEYSTKLWSINEEQKELLSKNRFFYVEGTLETYQGKEQLKLQNIESVNDEDYNPNDFINGVDGDMFLQQIYTCIEGFENMELKSVVKTCLERYEDKFKYNVAAEKFHHDLRGGLAYHTATILKSAEALSNVYTYLNKDLLYSGVILHDLLKCDEIESDDLGLDINYSTKGRLLGHISMGVVLIENVCNELEVKEEIKTILQHLVLCHHGQGEWGSPVKPMIPEGQVLHVLDKLDADLFNFERKLKEVNEGEFTERVFQLENRNLYKTKL